MSSALSLDQLRDSITPDVFPTLDSVTVVESIDSTNAALLRADPPPYGRFSVCTAMQQTAGRGRRGRQWVSAPGSGVYLSIGWTLPELRRDLPTLALAVGVAARRGLISLGAQNVTLKWPNDLMVRNGKLGGILNELRSCALGAYVVIGLGVNVVAPEGLGVDVLAQGGQPVRDLRNAGVTDPSLGATTRALIREISRMLPVYTTEGLTPFWDEWLAADHLRNRAIEWSEGERRLVGVARGIDADGLLLVETGADHPVIRLNAGEVTVRPAA